MCLKFGMLYLLHYKHTQWQDQAAGRIKTPTLGVVNADNSSRYLEQRQWDTEVSSVGDSPWARQCPRLCWLHLYK